MGVKCRGVDNSSEGDDWNDEVGPEVERETGLGVTVRTEGGVTGRRGFLPETERNTGSSGKEREGGSTASRENSEHKIESESETDPKCSRDGKRHKENKIR